MKKLFSLLAVLSILLGSQGFTTVRAALAQQEAGPDISGIIEKYRQQIPGRMQAEHIPGLALALVDDQDILWAEGFGVTDWSGGVPVTPDTPFSIQSMSKSFTGTAAVMAAQAGLADLDAPLPDYLPDFHINSIFEEHPEQQMTLRRLLSHTAGLMHEAPIGSNYDTPGHNTFEDHIASIQDTWLRAPVGKRWNYSNLGVDLAGYALAEKAGKSYPQFEQDTVLAPLGMTHSSFDINVIKTWKNRAIGHIDYPPYKPVETMLILPSGGLYTTANDMARYLRFHINRGEIDGKRLLSEAWAETMYTPPNVAAKEAGYGLCIAVHSQYGTRRLEHGGGGFGFNSEMIWYPELQLGIVVLTNSINDLYLRLAEDVLDDTVTAYSQPDRPRVLTPRNGTPALAPEQNSQAISQSELNQLILSKKLPIDERTLPRWQEYAGNYIALSQGLPFNDAKVEVDSSGLRLVVPGFGMNLNETEVEPGVFYDSTGDRLDLRGPRLETLVQPPEHRRLAYNYRNIAMVKLTPFRVAAKNFAMLLGGLATLLALIFWLLVMPAWLVARRRQAKRMGAAVQAPYPRQGWIWPFSLLAGLCGLVTVFVLANFPGLRLLPWPAPYLEAGLFWVVALGTPYAGAVFALAAAVVAGLAKKRALFPLAITLAMVGFFGLLVM